MQLSSDIIRDGLGLELIDSSDIVIAEVFRYDSKYSIAIKIFNKSATLKTLNDLVKQARGSLYQFEDRTPLPDSFTIINERGLDEILKEKTNRVFQ